MNDFKPKFSLVARVPAGKPRLVSGALVTQRLNRALRTLFRS